jgi:hypothetical protein
VVSNTRPSSSFWRKYTGTDAPNVATDILVVSINIIFRSYPPSFRYKKKRSTSTFKTMEAEKERASAHTGK